MPHPDFDAVIFDLDGTLLATEEMTLEAGHAALTRMGLGVPEGLLLSLVGVDEPTSRHILRTRLDGALDHDLLARLWSDEMTRLRQQRGIPLRPFAVELITALRGLPLPFAIATSSSRAQAEEKLAASGLRGDFDVVVTRSDVRRAKPAPDIYLLAAQRLRVAPSRSLAFEDSDVGARAARAAGMTVVQVPDMVALSGEHADLLARDLMAGARGIGLIAA